MLGYFRLQDSPMGRTVLEMAKVKT
jgi:hypothetical protein